MKLRTVNLIMLALTLSLFTSCKDEEKQPSASQTTTETKAKVNEESIKVNPAHGLPGHRCDLPVGAPLNGTPSTTNTTTTSNTQQTSTSVSPIRIDQTPDINPPHGEPYHDCSIPVGAKLEK